MASASKSPNPQLGKSQALNISQGTATRLNTVFSTLTTVLSPTTVYQPGATVGAELIAAPGGVPVTVAAAYGVWIAPDLLGNGAEYYVQVECFGGGGGGGGGNSTLGGGGGGGGEYACETQYPVKPGESYAYVVGFPGTSGYNTSSAVPGQANTGPPGGGNGGTTIFDLAGNGLASGVVAYGGMGGDQQGVGLGGQGGTGSGNSENFTGGTGATNNGGNTATDQPLLLATQSGMFVGNTLKASVIKAQYIMNDNTNLGTTYKLNDNTGDGWTANITNGSGSGNGLAYAQGTTPTQVPAYTQNFAAPVNETTANVALRWRMYKNAQLSGYAIGGFTIGGSLFTISAWVQCDPSGTWGENTNNITAVIANNCTGWQTDANEHGYALYLRNTSAGWTLNWYTSNGSAHHTITSAATVINPVAGTWYYVVATFNSGLMTLYVNNVSVASSTASFTSIPGGDDPPIIGIAPGSTSWYFGYMSNVWFANDCATATLVNAVYGGVGTETGGGGGGASGGPSATGGAGTASSGSVGGAGGVPPSQPSSLASTTTAAQGGYAGGNAAASGSTATPSGGPYGGGGGGGGDMGSPPANITMTIPFSSAATYCGSDGTSPGQPFNTNQQNNPIAGLNSLLYTGGLSSDTASGSKNSLLLLPKGLAASLGNGGWTITNVYLTFTNAFQNNTVDSILEFGYSADTVLPGTYEGASLVSYIGSAVIDTGSATQTYDITASGIGTHLANGTATAFVLGPGAVPDVDAYNAPTGPQFYCSIYGPGAANTAGVSQSPYLTIVLEKTLTVQHGSPGGGGAIVITAVNNSATLISAIQPFSGSDAGSNAYAGGYTGPVSTFHPGSSPAALETWQQLVLTSATASGNGVNGMFVRKCAEDEIELMWDIFIHSATNGLAIAGLASGYIPTTTQDVPSGWYGSGPTSYNAGFNPYLAVHGGTGVIAQEGIVSSGSLQMAGWARIPLAAVVNGGIP
jgi:Concanavalin A-like lectin/glucanases superfamily